METFNQIKMRLRKLNDQELLTHWQQNFPGIEYKRTRSEAIYDIAALLHEKNIDENLSKPEVKEPSKEAEYKTALQETQTFLKENEENLNSFGLRLLENINKVLS